MTKNILMVCLGNICRSPVAEGILKSKLTTDYYVDSAGIGGWHSGEQPDQRAIKTALNYGIDISKQRARKITIADFEKFDTIYAMDKDNLKELLHLAPNDTAKNKVKLLLSAAYPNKNDDVPDPYYGDLEDFNSVFTLLENALEIIATKIKKTANQ